MAALLTLVAVLALVVPALLRARDERAAPVGTPAAPAAPAPGVAASPAGAGPLRTILDERFAGSRAGWPNNPQSTAWFADGVYRLDARLPGQFVAVGAPVPAPLRDVVVTGTFRKVGGPAGGGYGIIIRDQGPGARDGLSQSGRFYVFEASDRGEVGIWRRDGDRWVDILPWTPSPVVAQGALPNTLTVWAMGPQLTFAVNGTQVASQRDAALAEGTVGIFVGGDLNEVAIERFLVQVPSEL